MDYDYIRRILWDLKEEHGTWVAIEKICRASSANIARIAKGEVEPSVDTLQKLHKAFPDVFPELKFAESAESVRMGLAAVKRVKKGDLNQVQTFAIPVFDAGAGEPSSFDDGGYPVGLATQYEATPVRGADPNTFCVIVHGISMLPLISPGDIVVVVPGAPLTSGCICFATWPNGDRLVKRYIQDGDRVILRSDNPNKDKFPDMPINNINHEGVRIYRIKKRIQDV